MNRMNPRLTDSLGSFELNDPDITLWIRKVRNGDETAFTKLFNLYSQRLKSYLRTKLTAKDRAEGFEEDLASECLSNIWRDLTEGRLNKVTNRGELWFAMMRIGMSKATDRKRYLSRRKRLFETVGLMASLNYGDLDSNQTIVDFELFDDWEGFLRTIEVKELREIARLAMDGLGVDELVERFDVVPKTIQRKLDLIQKHWEEFKLR